MLSGKILNINDINDIITTNVKILCKKNNVNQKGLSIILNMTQQSISKKFKRLDNWTLGNLYIVSQYFNVKIDDLFFNQINLNKTQTKEVNNVAPTI